MAKAQADPFSHLFDRYDGRVRFAEFPVQATFSGREERRRPRRISSGAFIGSGPVHPTFSSLQLGKLANEWCKGRRDCVLDQALWAIRSMLDGMPSPLQ